MKNGIWLLCLGASILQGMQPKQNVQHLKAVALVRDNPNDYKDFLATNEIFNLFVRLITGPQVSITSSAELFFSNNPGCDKTSRGIVIKYRAHPVLLGQEDGSSLEASLDIPVALLTPFGYVRLPAIKADVCWANKMCEDFWKSIECSDQEDLILSLGAKNSEIKYAIVKRFEQQPLLEYGCTNWWSAPSHEERMEKWQLLTAYHSKVLSK